ncbi:MAG: ASKHA domain-containing protein [Rhodospirillales bacterium]|nr:ASKHA domain-containing protein [Rhodospirillales bacterium]
MAKSKPKRNGADDALVIFMPSGRRGRFPQGTPLLGAARDLGVDIDSICGERGICGRCQVGLSTGVFAKFAITSEKSHLSPVGEVEKRFAKTTGLPAGRRLSCAARLTGDVVIDVPAESRIHKQMARKRADARAMEIDPLVRLHYVEIPKPGIGDQSSGPARLKRALAENWRLKGLDCDAGVLRSLCQATGGGETSGGDWNVTAAVREGKLITAVWPGFHGRAFGLAVDVGTTTVAAHLCDLATGEVVGSAGTMDPQIRFGEDVTGRLSYLRQNPDQAAQLTIAAREAVAKLAAELAGKAGIDLGDIIEATFVGNPVMHRLMLGIDPRQLGQAPLAMAADESVTLMARDLQLNLNPGAHAYFLPCIGGFLGADTAAVILSESPHKSVEPTLVLDIGASSEIVLGDNSRLLACSIPTGPAFEGARIGCGQRTAAGAIERVRIDRDSLAPRFKVIGSDGWSDDPGFSEAMADIGVTGICGSGIIEAVAEMFLAGIVDASGRIDAQGVNAKRTPRLLPQGRNFDYLLHAGPPELLVTQADIRAVQLAKSACYSGIRLLMDRMGVERVERIVLAGAFGAHIDAKYAMVIGMIPDCDPAKVGSAGNAAGTGARIALLSRQARAEIEALVKRVEKVETATAPEFQDYFVAAMDIPHASHGFPNLARTVNLPERPANHEN